MLKSLVNKFISLPSNKDKSRNKKIYLRGEELKNIQKMSTKLMDVYQKLGELESAFMTEKERLLSESKRVFNDYSSAVENLVKKHGGNLNKGSEEIWEFNPSEMTLERKN